MDGIQLLREEVATWKERCEEEDKRKSNATLAKLEADDLHKEAEEQLSRLLEDSDEAAGAMTMKQSHYEMEIQDLQRQKDELKRNLNELDCKVKEWRQTLERRRAELQVDNKLPHKDINCRKEESGSGNLSDICYTCQIVIRHPYILREGQALLTFEKEEVAQGVIDRGRHNVEFNNGREEVKTSKVELGRTVTFEVNMMISSTRVGVNNLPNDLPEETLRDKLELTFYKSNVGGGEIKLVEYNRNNNSACITYQEDGVAQRVLKTPRHLLTLGGSMYEVGISPVMEKQLNKLQIFSGICPRTALLAEITNQMESEDEIEDLVELHFQNPSNGGDEVECIAFTLKNKLAHFEDDAA